MATRHETKFPTKTHGPQQFAELSRLLREWEYDNIFDLNTTELTKLFKAQRFTPDQLQKLQEYAYDQISSTVRVLKPKDDDNA